MWLVFYKDCPDIPGAQAHHLIHQRDVFSLVRRWKMVHVQEPCGQGVVLQPNRPTDVKARQWRSLLTQLQQPGSYPKGHRCRTSNVHVQRGKGGDIHCLDFWPHKLKRVGGTANEL